jgi:RNA polymerase sigma-70 factor (ECF subfamily)
MLEDKLLIFKFKRGSSDALRCIYEKYRNYLLKLATALLYDVGVAEDVVHDVFLRFAQSSDQFKLNGSLKSYLRTCVVNAAHNKARAEQIRSSVNIDEIAPVAIDSNDSDYWAILKEDSVKIADALAQLPYEQREIVVLHLLGEMKFREIAKSQNVPLKTIQSRYRYGLDKLRIMLDTSAPRRKEEAQRNKNSKI